MLYAVSLYCAGMEVDDPENEDRNANNAMSESLQMKVNLIRMTGAAMTCFGKSTCVKLAGVISVIGIGTFEYWYNKKCNERKDCHSRLNYE